MRERRGREEERGDEREEREIDRRRGERGEVMREIDRIGEVRRGDEREEEGGDERERDVMGEREEEK